jgi:hypothetical protein
MIMNRRVLLVAGLTLGLSLPGAAHAQFLGRLVEDVARATQDRGRDDAPPRGPQRGPERPSFDQNRNGAQDRGPDRNDRGAQDDRGRGNPGPERPMRLVPLNQVVDQISRMMPGQLLNASPPEGGARPVYRIRWQANDGRRVDFAVDAQTGQIIGRNGG